MDCRALPLLSLALVATSFSPNRSVQQDPTSPQAITTLHASTRLVMVDVVVLDKNKQPVHGLKAEDFLLKENGRYQRFKAFEEHTAPTAAELAKVTELTKVSAPGSLPPGTYSNVASARFDGPLDVLILDRLNTPLADQSQMQKQILDFLARARPGQRMAIFGITDHLIMMHGFTTDLDDLKPVAESTKDLAPSPLLSKPRTAHLDSSGNASMLFKGQTGDESEAAAEPNANMDQSQRFEASAQAQLRTTYTLKAMNELAHYLAAFPGRKNVIWFSGSFPVDIMPKMDSDQIKATSPASIHNFDAIASQDKQFLETEALLSRSQVALYPLDVKGLKLSTIFTGADDGCGSCPANSIAAVLHGITNTSNAFGQKNFDEHSTMNSLADNTGGKAFINTNDLTDAINKSIDDGANYYTISYTPANTNWNGDFRDIEVKLRRKGYEISYRRGYFAQDVDILGNTTDLISSSAMRIALVHGGPEPTQLMFSTRVLPVSADTEPLVAANNKANENAHGPYRRYQVDYSINAREVRFLQGLDGNRHETLEFVTCVYNADGKLVNSIGNSIITSVTPAEYAQFRQTGIPFHQEVSVPAKGEYYLRIAIHDVEANLVGAVELPIASVSTLQPLQAAK